MEDCPRLLDANNENPVSCTVENQPTAREADDNKQTTSHNRIRMNALEKIRRYEHG